MSTGPILLDESKAKPVFGGGGGQKSSSAAGRDSESEAQSKYLEECREEDPWPPEEDEQADAKIVLSNLKFETQELAVNEEFLFSLDTTIGGCVKPMVVRVYLYSIHTDESGAEIEENQVPQGIEVIIPKGGGPMEAKGTLYIPDAKFGEKICFYLKAEHSLAESIKSEKVCLIRKIDVWVVEVPDLHFHHNSAVPCLDENSWLTSALAVAATYAKDNCDKELIVFGHTDTSGEFDYNYNLSELRAMAVQAILDDNKENWKKIVKEKSKVKDYQQMFKSLFLTYGWKCDPGAVDNQDGPKTQAAVKAFQKEANEKYSTGLAEDGKIGPNTWCGILTVIRELTKEACGGSLPSFKYGFAKGKGIYGCGESFPIEEAEKQNYRSQENRRVELVFIKPGSVHLLPWEKPTEKMEAEDCAVYNPEIVHWHMIVMEHISVELCYADGTPLDEGIEIEIKQLGSNLTSGTTKANGFFQSAPFAGPECLEVVVKSEKLKAIFWSSPMWFTKQTIFLNKA